MNVRVLSGAAAAAALVLSLVASPAAAQAVLPDDIAAAVRNDAAAETGGNPVDVEVLRVEPVIWDDGCIGLPPVDEACTLALTPGWVVWAASDDEGLRYHTGADGAYVRLAERNLDTTTAEDAPLPDGATRADDDDSLPGAPDEGGGAGTEVQTYVVVPGDTLATIAARYGTSVVAIAERNEIDDADMIHVGQVLELEAAQLEGGGAPGGEPYTVRTGDTLGAIASRVGATVDVLAELNSLPDVDRIYEGQLLRLP